MGVTASLHGALARSQTRTQGRGLDGCKLQAASVHGVLVRSLTRTRGPATRNPRSRQGTELDPATNLCVSSAELAAAAEKTRRATGARIETRGGNIVLKVNDGKQVGYQIGEDADEVVTFDEPSPRTIDSVIGALRLGYEHGKDTERVGSLAAIGRLEQNLSSVVASLEKASDDLSVELRQVVKDETEEVGTAVKKVEKQNDARIDELGDKVKAIEKDFDKVRGRARLCATAHTRPLARPRLPVLARAVGAAPAVDCRARPAKTAPPPPR